MGLAVTVLLVLSLGLKLSKFGYATLDSIDLARFCVSNNRGVGTFFFVDTYTPKGVFTLKGTYETERTFLTPPSFLRPLLPAGSLQPTRCFVCLKIP
jgi:hypothetical protein